MGLIEVEFEFGKDWLDKIVIKIVFWLLRVPVFKTLIILAICVLCATSETSYISSDPNNGLVNLVLVLTFAAVFLVGGIVLIAAVTQSILYIWTQIKAWGKPVKIEKRKKIRR